MTINDEAPAANVPRMYKGVVRFVDDASYAYGYVDQKTLVPIDGAPPLESPENEGIYILGRDCNRPLRIGMEVIFRVEKDIRREGCFRALGAEETSDSRLESLVHGGIQIGTPDKELQDATFFVTWCLSAEVAAKMKKRLLMHKDVVQLLLVQYRLTGNENKPFDEEKRQLVKLDDDVAVLSFNSSGKHRVVAAVVCGSTANDLKDTYLKVRNGKYSTDVMASAGDCFLWGNGLTIIGSGCVDFEIPAQLFAEKPWAYDWVNSFFKEKKPKDECRFFWRRVVVFAYHIVRGPFIAVVSLLKLLAGALIAGILLGLGMERVAFKALLKHPYRTPLGYIWNDLGGSRYLVKKGDRDFIIPIVFSPVLWVLVLIAVFGYATQDGGVPVSAKQVEGVFLNFAISMGAVAFVIVLVGSAIYWAEGVKWDEKFTAIARNLEEAKRKSKESKSEANYQKWLRASRLRDEEEKLRTERIEREVLQLICTTTGPRTPDVARLPFSPKTFYFKVIDWKRKRCRNFSAS